MEKVMSSDLIVFLQDVIGMVENLQNQNCPIQWNVSITNTGKEEDPFAKFVPWRKLIDLGGRSITINIEIPQRDAGSLK